MANFVGTTNKQLFSLNYITLLCEDSQINWESSFADKSPPKVDFHFSDPNHDRSLIIRHKMFPK